MIFNRYEHNVEVGRYASEECKSAFASVPCWNLS